MLLEVTWIEKFKSASRPYEGHHPVSVDSIRAELVPVDLYAGDWVIPSKQGPNAISPKCSRLEVTMRFWFGTSLTRRSRGRNIIRATSLKTLRKRC